MNHSGTFLVVLFSFLTWYSTAQDRGDEIYAGVLQKHVNERGNVDYRKLKTDLAGLDAYLDYLALHPPSQDSRRVDSLAYFINLYNAATLRLVAENYPVSSIQEIDDPWNKKFVRSGNKLLSLQQIEHQILRSMDEPRVHFAINCASVSCPPLLNQPFYSEKIEQQLDVVTRNFITNDTYNDLDAEPLRLSRIFDWYKEDFGGSEGVVLFISKYIGRDLDVNLPLTYSKYNWQLNEQR